MAQGKPIGYSDIANEQDIARLKKDLSELSKMMATLRKEMAENKKAISGNPLGDGKALKSYNEALATSTDLTEDMLRLKTQQIKTEKKLAAAHTADARELAKAKLELAEFSKEQKQSIKLGVAAEGSMNKLSLSLAKNKKQYRELTEVQRKNDKVGGKLLKSIKKQDAQVKKLDATLGDHQRNVGNYSGALSGLVSQFGVLPPQISGAVQSMKMMNISLKTMRGAIMATGIGALVIALVSLYQHFTRTEEGAAKFNKILNYIKVPIEVLMQKLGELGGKLMGVFENPKQAASDFMDFLKSQVTNRIEALGGVFTSLGNVVKNLFNPEEAKKHLTALTKHAIDFSTGIKNTTDKVEGALNKGLEEAAEKIKQANDLEDRGLLITQKKRKLQVEEAKLQAQISEQRKIANDETQEARVQAEAIMKAQILTKELSQKRLEIARLELSILTEKAAMFDSDAATLDEIAAKEAEIFNIEKARDDQLKSILRRESTINNKLKERIPLMQSISAIGGTDNEKKTTDEFTKLSNERTKATNLEAENRGEKYLTDEEYQANALASTGEMMTGISSMMAEGSAEQKAFAIAAATVNTFQTISGILKGFSQLPQPWGMIAGAIAAASAAVTGFEQVRAITNQPTPKAKKYALGTEYLQRNGNPAGTDTIPIYANEGERIVPTEINKMMLGVPNAELPSLVAQGKSAQSGIFKMIARNTSETNRLLSGFKYMDKNGNLYDLIGNKQIFA